MKRKIMKLGPATMVISLPSKWVKSTNVKAGDEIELNEENGALILNIAEKNNIVTRESIDVSPYDKLIKRIVVSRYLKGDDEIEVIYNNLDKSRIIQKRIEELIGMEIISQTKDRIIIKDMSGTSEDNFENVVKRILYLLNTLVDESLKTIKEKSNDLEYTIDIERNINKFTDYCFRVLNKGHSDHRRTAVLYCVLFLIEEIADEYKNMNRYIINNKMKLNESAIELYSRVNQYSKNMQKLFTKFSFEEAIILAEERDKIISSIEKQYISKKTTAQEIILLKHLETITNHIVKISGELLNIN